MSDDEDDGRVAELTKTQAKNMKDEHKRVFLFERSLIHGADNTMVIGGLDDDTNERFTTFLADPGRYVCGSDADEVLRPRVNLLQVDPLFSSTFSSIRAEARSRLDNPKHKHDDTVFNTLLGAEILAELAACYVIWHNTTENIACKRDCTQIVSVLRAKKLSLLALSASDLKEFKTRSFVSLAIASNSHRKTSLTHNANTTSSTYNDNHKRERSPQKDSKDHRLTEKITRRQKPTLKNAQLRCTKCSGIGHDDQNCVKNSSSPPHFVCFICSGKGHTASACTSEVI